MLNKSILSYQGPFSFSTIDRLLAEFKYAAQDQDLSFRTYKKMISIMIEALENITKYNDQIQSVNNLMEKFSPSCHIRRNDSSIEFITKNPVKKIDADRLRERIDKVNSQNREELKALYRSTIANGEFSALGGAGLGIIEIAKTADNKLEYQFESITSEYVLYTFRVRVAV